MQTPTEKTPVSKCVELSRSSSLMMSKWTEKPVLADLSKRMADEGQKLKSAQAEYAESVQARLETRVELKYVNLIADRRIRKTLRKAEIDDDKTGGPIATAIFPDGMSPIVRAFGASQVKAMEGLEARLNPALGWKEAETEKKELAEIRERYDGAVKAREAAWKKSKDLKAVRDAVKRAFVVTYAEIAHRVEAEFPKDKEPQDRFFDEVSGGRPPCLPSCGSMEPGNSGRGQARGPAPTRGFIPVACCPVHRRGNPTNDF